MSCKRLLSLLCLVSAVFLFTEITSARFELRVDESHAQISFAELSPRVLLPIENGSRAPLGVNIRVELVDTNDRVQGAAQANDTIKVGRHQIAISLPVKTRELLPVNESNILWFRLHYKITPQSDVSISPLEGFISLSNIAPELFELSVTGPATSRVGSQYRARVRASHPISHVPAPNVQIKASLTFDEDDLVLNDGATTDKDGYAYLNFSLPNKISQSDGQLAIEGSRGPIVITAEKEIDIQTQPYAYVSTDKPLYQPGQTLHTRLLLLNTAKKAIKDRSVEVKVTDPEDTVVFASELTTSSFGIASVDWAIPESTRLGEYEVTFTDDDDLRSSTTIKISRYDLPNFTVNATPDRSYYLKGQRAAVQINADYLFGQPVTHGHVRLVRETERHWNYREQKYEIVEGEKYEGEIGANNVFTAQINLGKSFEELEAEDYSRFLDLPYQAYFTDSTTNRTEQKRFNIRITKQSIHIYVIHPEGNYAESNSLPLRFYVSTFYADGSPAQCDVSIDEQGSKNQFVLRTNRYGLATVDGFKVLNIEGREFSLHLAARDHRGKTGDHTEDIEFRDEPAIRVLTPKALYRRGEPITISILSNQKNATVNFDVTRDSNLINSERVTLHNGQASLVIPYRDIYEGELTLAAHLDSENSEVPISTRTILFPHDSELRVQLQSAKSLRPGEQAHVSFRATSAAGNAIQSALGVVVIDEAVEERIRSDQDFGSRYSGFYRMLFADDAIGNVTRRSLDKIDMAHPVSPELDLAAEILLNQSRNYHPVSFSGDNYSLRVENALSTKFLKRVDGLKQALGQIYDTSKVFPTNEIQLRQLLSQEAFDFDSLLDPWGNKLRPEFSFETRLNVLTIKSAGPDKTFNTDDDVALTRLTWPYFWSIGRAIDLATAEFHTRTGQFIRDFASLQREMQLKGIQLERLTNPWGLPYRFDFTVDGNYFLISVSTQSLAGGTLELDRKSEFQVWQSRMNYFEEARIRIDAILNKKVSDSGQPIQSESDLRKLLKGSPVDLDGLRDPWSHLYYVTADSKSFYADDVKIETVVNANQSSERLNIKPVTKTAIIFNIRSSGPDGIEGTTDDFTAANFNTVVSSQSAIESKPQPTKTMVLLSGSSGAISGTVTDPMGAVIAHARVSAKHFSTLVTYEATTDENGHYLLRNLPAGNYELHCDSFGFRSLVMTSVWVRSSNITEVNLRLEVGNVSETVSVVAEGVNVDRTSASVATTVRKPALTAIAAPKQKLSTPRLREYFPETLVWQPELTTDKRGRAQLDFKLADNITTWKLSVIGSTVNGEIGTAETELRAFQPFFAELDPPRVLTEGDRISLPVVLRNYLDRKQQINVQLKPATWFRITGPNSKQTDVPPGDSTTQTFDIETIASIKDGKQQVSALGGDESDAIEKPVTVHPDGEEKATTFSDLLDQTTSWNIEIPAVAIAGSANVELKIYPNLMAHVAESIEGIMKRPYGCGEQTISSTYPSLLMLRYLEQQKVESELTSVARKYLQIGYQRLLGYQSVDGGFSYWGDNKSDLALTAYALHFLNDAKSLLDVDEKVTTRAAAFLVRQQQSDGRWKALDWQNLEDRRRTALLTSLVARSLAAERNSKSKSNSATLGVQIDSLNNALNYLEQRSLEIDEPYLIASYALATFESGQQQRGAIAAVRLASLAHSEGSRSYWSLETNTPFYGWGLAGRLETTALAVQALMKVGANDPSQSQSYRNLIARGLNFLLHNKDRYGVWYSTQATVKVLDAIVASLSKSSGLPASNNTCQILVGGRPVRSVEIEQSPKVSSPLIINLSEFIKPGTNSIEVTRRGDGAVASLQTVTTYYVPWSPGTAITTVRSGDSESLRFETSFDRLNARINESITCKVKAKRIGFRGYGMLLAEIGLPPGVDVDRESLEAARQSSGWAISQYDILPDRVVVYLWPSAGGIDFNFKFKPRLKMSAKSSPSTLYDYYNPDARSIVEPTKFEVK